MLHLKDINCPWPHPPLALLFVSFLSHTSSVSPLLSSSALCHAGGAVGVRRLGQSQVSDRCRHPQQQRREHPVGHGFPQLGQVCVNQDAGVLCHKVTISIQLIISGLALTS